ncbi:hypothetical protein [Caminibacter pacificus]
MKYLRFNLEPIYLTKKELQNYFKSLGINRIPDLFEGIEVNGYTIFITEKKDDKYLLNIDLSDGFNNEMEEILSLNVESIDEDDFEEEIYLFAIHSCPSINAIYVEYQEADNDYYEPFIIPLFKAQA